MTPTTCDVCSGTCTDCSTVEGQKLGPHVHPLGGNDAHLHGSGLLDTFLCRASTDRDCRSSPRAYDVLVCMPCRKRIQARTTDLHGGNA